MDQLLNANTWRSRHNSMFYLYEFPYLSPHNIEPDELHIINLATSRHILGSVLWLLALQVLDGATPEADMGQVWDEVVDYYKDSNVTTQFSNLTLTSFHNENQDHCLSSKGAESKAMVRATHAKWQSHCNP